LAENEEIRQRRGWLDAALEELSPRERHIVRERALRDERATLSEIGVHLGVTKERVRQIEHKALAKLRQSVLRHSRSAPGATWPS
jgi:RNA polymerase sigma-32 factor